jgi:peptidoglycan-associated lipoprotein
MFLRFDKSGTKGYLVSNRPNKEKQKLGGSETCCDDIYEVTLKELVIDLAATISDDKGPLAGGTIEVYDLTQGGYPEIKSNPNANNFNAPLNPDRNYKVVFKREGYYPDSITFNTVGIIDDYTVKKDIILKKAPEKPKDNDGDIVVVTVNEPIRLNNIYYDLNKWNILPDAERDLSLLNGLMEDYPDMVIELSSHTDAQGSVKSNQTLSQRRAESARNWLLQRGISPSRIIAKGYGESVIINHCTEGVKCSDDEHRQNRRTEFKIIAGPQTIEIKKETFKESSVEQPRRQSGKQSFRSDTVPVISFEVNEIELGQIKKGEKRELEFNFTNTGKGTLLIELATTCKCTNIEYPTTPIESGGKGKITAIYDTTHEKIGKIRKTIDIIANTEPIVVEAIFMAEIIE